MGPPFHPSPGPHVTSPSERAGRDRLPRRRHTRADLQRSPVPDTEKALADLGHPNPLRTDHRTLSPPRGPHCSDSRTCDTGISLAVRPAPTRDRPHHTSNAVQPRQLSVPQLRSISSGTYTTSTAFINDARTSTTTAISCTCPTAARGILHGYLKHRTHYDAAMCVRLQLRIFFHSWISQLIAMPFRRNPTFGNR